VRRSIRRIPALTFSTLLLTVSATLVGTVAASGVTVTDSCTGAGGVDGVTISACIQVVSPGTPPFEGNALVTSTWGRPAYVSLLMVTQICNSAGSNCSNIAKTYTYRPRFPLAGGTVTAFNAPNTNSFGHKYRGCVLWLLPDGSKGGGACSAARSI
jgi:hypothetical protein